MNYTGQKRAQSNNIAVINGEKINIDQFYTLLQNEYDKVKQETGQDLTDIQRDRIRDQLWQKLLTEILVNQQIQKKHITATDREIIFQLREFPPDIVRSIEAFQTDGKFDYQKYLDALNNPVGDEWLAVENYVRSVVPTIKIQNLIQATTLISYEELRNYYIDKNINFTIEYLMVKSAAIPDNEVIVDSSEVEKYFSENKERFLVPERRVLRYVNFPLKPTREDSTLAYEEALSIKEKILAGADFGEMAKIYSDGPTGPNGGDLGWFPRGQMVAEFEAAAFKANPGDIIGPVLTQFGYHLIKVNDKRMKNNREEVNAQHILFKVLVGPNTRNKLESAARIFSYDAQDMGFDEALEVHELSADTTDPISEDVRFIFKLGNLPEVARFAFRSEVNDISDIIRNDENISIFQLIEIQPEHYRPLKDLWTSIEKRLRSEKKIERTRAIAQEMYNNMDSNANWEKMAADNQSLEYKKPSPFTLNRAIPGIGREATLVGALRIMEPGEISPPLKLPRGYTIVRLISRDEFNEEDFQSQQESLVHELYQRKANQMLTTWLDNLKENAKIVDNRRQFF
jgi:parvulin-like peptidyl-prolyl isomerase